MPLGHRSEVPSRNCRVVLAGAARYWVIGTPYRAQVQRDMTTEDRHSVRPQHGNPRDLQAALGPWTVTAKAWAAGSDVGSRALMCGIDVA